MPKPAIEAAAAGEGRPLKFKMIVLFARLDVEPGQRKRRASRQTKPPMIQIASRY